MGALQWARAGTLLMTAALCGASAQAGPNYHGRVSRVGPTELVITIGTEEFTFVVSSKARIEVNGSSAPLESIRKGAGAVVVAERYGDVRVARHVVALQKPQLAPPGPLPTVRSSGGKR